MPFGVVSGVGRGLGILDGGRDRRRESGSFRVNKRVASNCNQWDSLREGRRCGSSQIILGFLVAVVAAFSVSA